MNLLLDTNVLLWALANPERLRGSRTLLASPENRVYVSAVCAWEIAIKMGIGKLDAPPNAASWLPAQMETAGFTPLPIGINHALAVEGLPRHHADPFDRLLIAQAVVEQLTIVTSDQQLERYAVEVIRA